MNRFLLIRRPFYFLVMSINLPRKPSPTPPTTLYGAPPKPSPTPPTTLYGAPPKPSPTPPTTLYSIPEKTRTKSFEPFPFLDVAKFVTPQGNFVDIKGVNGKIPKYRMDD